MIDALLAALRVALAAVGLLAPDVAGLATMGAIALVLATAAVIIVAVVATTPPERRTGSTRHRARRAELSALLEQSDPNAAGHVRRRGPGHAAAAA